MCLSHHHFQSEDGFRNKRAAGLCDEPGEVPGHEPLQAAGREHHVLQPEAQRGAQDEDTLHWRPDRWAGLALFWNVNTLFGNLHLATWSTDNNKDVHVDAKLTRFHEGVAQKHYDTSRTARERMPGRITGQVYSYPQVSHSSS